MPFVVAYDRPSARLEQIGSFVMVIARHVQVGSSGYFCRFPLA